MMDLLVENARAFTTVVVEEGEAIGDALLSIIEALTTPFASTNLDGRGLLASIALGARDLATSVALAVAGTCSWSRGSTTTVLVDPGHDFAIDSGSDDITDGAFFFGFAMEVSMAMTTSMEAGFGIALLRFGTEGIISKLLEFKRTTEMPGDLGLSRQHPSSSANRG